MDKAHISRKFAAVVCCAVLLSLCGCGSSGAAEDKGAAAGESMTETSVSTAAVTTSAEKTETVTSTVTSATETSVTAAAETTAVTTSETTAAETTTTAQTEAPKAMMPEEIVKKKKADGTLEEYGNFDKIPAFKAEVPEEITPDLYMYAEEHEITGHAVGYSDSRYGLGVTLFKGPSAAFSKATDYPVPYGQPVDVYARYEVSGDRKRREHGFVYSWLYCCYNGVWGWCEDYELCRHSFLLPDVTMPDKYFEPYAGSRPTSDGNGYYFIKAESLKVMSSPDDSGEPQDILNSKERIRLLGTTIPESNWTFISYYSSGEKLGWVYIDSVAETLYTISEYYSEYPLEEPALTVDKPAIYLYPEKTTDVSVKLSLNGMELKTTYPKYSGGWNVTAYPDGRLLNKADGHSYDYLFWDAGVNGQPFDLSRGFCVKGSGSEEFLREKLTLLGLNETEMNEFIVYWLPIMENNGYNYITFQTDCYTDRAGLVIEPKPDTLLRVFMTVTPLDEPVNTVPQKLKKTVRSGFTAVEWGGSVIEADLF